MELSKSVVILDIFESLNKGLAVNKQELADKYNRDPKTIQRYIREIKDYYYYLYPEQEIDVKYSRSLDGHQLSESNQHTLTNKELLAICKIILDRRAFNDQELEKIIDKLIKLASSEEESLVKDMILNEKFYYTTLQHEKPLLDIIWDLNKAIREQKLLEIEYRRGGNEKITRTLKPLGLIFSEYYYYLIAEFKEQTDDYKIPYRLDRIIDYDIIDQHFKVPYADRFEEGQFKKRVQFMIPGKLARIKLKYWGPAVEIVLDRLPTANILEEKDNCYIIEAEIFGRGIEQWILSQGGNIEVLEPIEIRESIKDTAKEISAIYN